MQSSKPKRIGIWGNTEKPAFWDLLPSIARWAEKRDLNIFLTTRIIAKVGDKPEFDYSIIESADDFKQLDFILSLGGDGTLLALARAVGDRETPILGIHLGELGFLAEVTTENMFEKLDRVASGDFEILERMVLECTVQNGDEPQLFHALNDIAIDRGASHRMINCELNANGNHIAHYKADGLIVSTPTGSTAYSLSAGGPIVMPSLDAMVVTPICPHTLTLRPIVLPDDKTIEITFPDNQAGGLGLAVDGQVQESLDLQAKVTIRKASYKIQMIIFSDTNYFDVLSKKMGWGRRGE
ncbi:MAG: NAD(+)/NADH kinase [Candidatus Marinimicrobia bacterium]|nr:NAD(+)/NADH kinase [Candidatus Neomarinimicrobiota bacterium]